jgi:iron complex transport system ATP-binding protein
MLEIQNLYFNYGKLQVLKDINLRAKSGEFIGIIGPNGAGKSTLIKVIDRVLPADSARILFEGADLNVIARRDLARIIAYLPQENNFTFSYTVREVVMMGRYPYLQGIGIYGHDDLQVIKSVMNLFEIEQFAERHFNELSGGEKQRVLIASALAQRPKIMLLDEPTNALDLHHQLAIFNILRKLRQEQNLTIIVVTHDINLAAQFCDRIVLMKDGTIIRDGEPAAVLQFQLLQDIFGVKVYIDINPLTNCLYILPYE